MTDFTQKFYDRIAPVIDLEKARKSLAIIKEEHNQLLAESGVDTMLLNEMVESDLQRSIENICSDVLMDTVGILTVSRLMVDYKQPYGTRKDGCELLALLAAFDPDLGYWYLHIRPLPNQKNIERPKYAASLICLSVYLDGYSDYFFDKFYHWIKQPNVLKQEMKVNKKGNLKDFIQHNAYKEYDNFTSVLAEFELTMEEFYFNMEDSRFEYLFEGDEEVEYSILPINEKIKSLYLSSNL